MPTPPPPPPPYPRWIADATGVLMAIVMLALIGYFLGEKAHLWQSPSGGFWIL